MNKSFRRILDLVRRTGDRMVVTDPEGEDAFVVMDLDQYEALVELEEDFFKQMESGEEDEGEEDGGEDGLPPEGPDQPNGPPEPPADIWDVMTPAGSDEETWDLSKLTPAERAELERQFAETEKKFSPGAPPAPAETPQETPSEAEKPKGDEEFGEEQFYLEPIE